MEDFNLPISQSRGFSTCSVFPDLPYSIFGHIYRAYCEIALTNAFMLLHLSNYGK